MQPQPFTASVVQILPTTKSCAIAEQLCHPMRAIWLAAALSGLLCNSLVHAGEQLERPARACTLTEAVHAVFSSSSSGSSRQAGSCGGHSKFGCDSQHAQLSCYAALRPLILCYS
jgi:hypothetical protein